MRYVVLVWEPGFSSLDQFVKRFLRNQVVKCILERCFVFTDYFRLRSFLVVVWVAVANRYEGLLRYESSSCLRIAIR